MVDKRRSGTLHMAHKAVALVERAWSDSPEQAQERARQVVMELGNLGLLKDAEVGAEFVYATDLGGGND